MKRRTGRGSSHYEPAPPRIVLGNDTPGTALHELIHHVQTAPPAPGERRADFYFQSLHRRRTQGERQVELPSYNDPKTVGRLDQYVDDYFGCEYDWASPYWPEGNAVEVMTRAIQSTFHPVGREELLPRLIDEDPEMLHLTLGLLFRYDPL